MTGDWARQDIFTGIFDKVIISVLSEEDPHIQAPLCTSVKLNWEWRFHFPSSWPQPLVFFSPGHRWGRSVRACSARHRPTVLIAVVMLLQCGAVSKSTLNRTSCDHVLQRPDRGECPSQDGGLPVTGTKRTVSFSENNIFLHTVSLSRWEIIQVVCCSTAHAKLLCCCWFSSLRLWTDKFELDAQVFFFLAQIFKASWATAMTC